MQGCRAYPLEGEGYYQALLEDKALYSASGKYYAEVASESIGLGQPCSRKQWLLDTLGKQGAVLKVPNEVVNAEG